VGTAAERAAALIPRHLLFADPDRLAVRLSSDGRRLAFVAPANGVLNVWAAPLHDVRQARPLTWVTDRGVAPWISWLPNNRHVLFSREQGGDENWQLHRVDVDSGEIRPLTPGPGVHSWAQQISHRFPDEVLISHNQRDERYFDLYRVNAVTGASQRIEVNDRFAFLFTDPHFRVRFGALRTDDGGIDYLRRGPTGQWELFVRVDLTDDLTTRPVEVGDDDADLYWLDSRGRDLAAVVAQSLTTGATRVMAEDSRADMDEVVLEPRTYRPLAAAATAERKRWHAVDARYAADLAAITKPPGELSIVGISDDTRTWLLYYEHDVRSGQYVHYDRAARTSRPLFAARRGLERRPLAPMEPVTIRARDGLDLVSYLSRPRDAARGAAVPMVLLVHGGPWGRDGWGLSSTHQWLANRGYAVLSVNYRGSTGLGKRFLNAGNFEWGGRMHDDLIDAVDWAVARGIADPRRVAIYGGSYGGYAALVGLTFTPEKFACAVDLFGISNLNTLMDTVPPYWKPIQSVWKTRMGDYTTEAGRRFLDERSPLQRVERIVRPLLIGQGANDVRVKPSESEQIVAAMRARAIPVTYVYYPDEGHGFRRPENRRSFNAVAEAFLAAHLGGRFEPVGDDFVGSSIEFRAGRELIPGLA
ncbi:MAG TPA: S9 family peptidase, partial [Methylomirabilota bacterium]|nr:S9 family peptidase [Methylomirabilota bacterium]